MGEPLNIPYLVQSHLSSRQLYCSAGAEFSLFVISTASSHWFIRLFDYILCMIQEPPVFIPVSDDNGLLQSSENSTRLKLAK